MHPLQGGILRLKHPSERRPSFPRENAWIFWPRFVWETVAKQSILVAAAVRLLSWALAIKLDARARSYSDLSLTRVSDDDEDVLDLVTKTTGGRSAVAHIKKIAALTHETPRAAAG